jgi:hypothetical protein
MTMSTSTADGAQTQTVPPGDDQLRPWIVWVIGILLGLVGLLLSIVLANGPLRHVCEAIGAALIGGSIAAGMIELRFHDRLIKKMVTELGSLLKQQHETLLNSLKGAIDLQIDKLEKVVSTKSDEALPMALQQLFDGTSPDAKLQSRTTNITNAVAKLKTNRSWTDDVSLRFIGELLFHVSENAVAVASAREGGAHRIMLPPTSASLAARILATQMRLMEKGDQYIVLSDLSSWRDGLGEFQQATVDAVEHGVRVRRLICPFEHDEDLDEATVREILKTHWAVSNDSQKDEHGMPIYQLGAVRRSVAKHRQLHHIGIFKRGNEGVKFEPQSPDLSVMRFERIKDEEPANLSDLWPQSIRSYREVAKGCEPVSFDDAWAALGANWWKQ